MDEKEYQELANRLHLSLSTLEGIAGEIYRAHVNHQLSGNQLNQLANMFYAHGDTITFQRQRVQKMVDEADAYARQTPNEQLELHLLVDKLETGLRSIPPHLGYRGYPSAAWSRDTMLAILGESGYARLIATGYIWPAPSEPRYYRYSYTPRSSAGPDPAA